MDMVPPVNTAIFPTQRSTRRVAPGFASAYTQAEATDRDEPVSLRINRPLANISMLLEILSEAGDAVNSNESTNVYELKRRRDDNRLRDALRNQYSFDFIE